MLMQRCPRCKEIRGQEGYHASAWGTKGKWCKSCQQEYGRARAKRLWDEYVNSEEYKEKKRIDPRKGGRKPDPKVAVRKAQERLEIAIRQRIRDAEKALYMSLIKKYGYSEDIKERLQCNAKKFGLDFDYVLGLYSNNPKCEICGLSQEAAPRMLSMDHCHTQGHFRGLLCDNCNTGLGLFKDNIELLQEAIKYLEK